MPRTYKPKPLVPKICLACGSQFQGTPAATRCPTCRTNGVKVPAARRSANKQAGQAGAKDKRKRTPKAPPKDAPSYEKVCQACHDEFTTHKPKAARCPSCIAEDRKVKKRKCLECSKPFPLFDDTHVNCKSCADFLDLDQADMTPEQAAKLAHEEHLKRHKERLQQQNEWLDARERKPKGYTAMLKRDQSQPLSILWVELCAADGAASTLMATAQADHGLTEDQKVTLLTSFYRLRCKGYHPSAISKLCPKALLKDAAQNALTDLPEVTEPSPTDIHAWGQIAARATLGLL